MKFPEGEEAAPPGRGRSVKERGGRRAQDHHMVVHGVGPIVDSQEKKEEWEGKESPPEGGPLP